MYEEKEQRRGMAIDLCHLNGRMQIVRECHIDLTINLESWKVNGSRDTNSPWTHG